MARRWRRSSGRTQPAWSFLKKKWTIWTMTFKKIRFIADSTCDIPPDVLQKWNIAIIPAFVNYGGGGYADAGEEIDRGGRFDQIGSVNSQPPTPPPPPGAAGAIFFKIAAGCGHVGVGSL